MKDTRRTAYWPLQGGEDLVTPLYSRKPGTLVSSNNFECDSGGRPRRIAGYERFDGQPSPSDASYWIIYFDTGTAEVSADDTVSGADSSATGTALIDGVLESGTYVGGDASGYIILYNVTGTFQSDEDLEVSGSPVCVSTTVASERGADDTTLDTTYYRAAIEATRDNISAVPGSGDVLGVWSYNDTKYAFRNDEDDTVCVMYESSTSGWSEVDLGSILYFDAGTVEFTLDETLTDGGSGATGTIKNYVLTSGDWDGSGVGYIILHDVTGDFGNNNAITCTSGGSATANGTDAAITLTKDGRYDFINYNFGGHAGTYMMFGCDGTNNAFQFDGTTYTPIFTGMTTDTPTHIFAHKNYLFLSFSGGSVQHSSVGNPLEWSAVTGADELGLGQEISGFSGVSGGLLSIFGRNKIAILYGSSTDDWELKTLSLENGAIDWSVQKLAEPLCLDNTGISSVSAIQAFGDFKTTALSGIIEPFFVNLTQKTLTASLRCRTKEQYRLYFDDKTGLNVTFSNGKLTGFTRLDYINVVTCACSGEDTNGNEVMFFGSDDGYVYQLDKGTSFDGEAIDALFKTSINTLGTPENKKRVFKIVLERDDLLGPSEWGIASWDNFSWEQDGQERDESYLDEAGDTGYDYVYYSSSAYLEPFTIQGIILHYSIGGLKR